MAEDAVENEVVAGFLELMEQKEVVVLKEKQAKIEEITKKVNPLQYFLKEYKSVQKGKYFSSDRIAEFIQGILESLDRVSDIKSLLLSEKNDAKLEQYITNRATLLGFSIGNLIKLFTDILANPEFYTKNCSKEVAIRGVSNGPYILTMLARISEKLKKTGLITKKRHIEKVLKTIMSERSGLLTPEHKQFLAQAAAVFA